MIDITFTESAPVRTLINGHCHSVPEGFFDSFIIAEIEKQPAEFMQAQVVGSVIVRYQLGINTGFICRRMEVMIERGLLSPLDTPPEGRLLYHRRMKRNI